MAFQKKKAAKKKKAPSKFGLGKKDADRVGFMAWVLTQAKGINIHSDQMWGILTHAAAEKPALCKLDKAPKPNAKKTGFDSAYGSAQLTAAGVKWLALPLVKKACHKIICSFR